MGYVVFYSMAELLSSSQTHALIISKTIHAHRLSRRSPQNTATYAYTTGTYSYYSGYSQAQATSGGNMQEMNQVGPGASDSLLADGGMDWVSSGSGVDGNGQNVMDSMGQQNEALNKGVSEQQNGNKTHHHVGENATQGMLGIQVVSGNTSSPTTTSTTTNSSSTTITTANSTTSTLSTKAAVTDITKPPQHA